MSSYNINVVNNHYFKQINSPDQSERKYWQEKDDSTFT